MTSRSFSYLKIASIGSGFFALSLVWMAYNAFMPLILGEHIQSKAVRGGIMGLDNFFAVFLIPFIGAWSDRLKTRYGKRLPFIAVGMPLAAVFFALLALARNKLWTLMAVDLFFLLSMTLYRAPVIALMPDHTPEDKRATANGVINLMGGLGTLVALFALGPLWDVNRSFPFFGASILLLLSFLFLWFQIDRSPPFAGDTAEENDEVVMKRSLRHGLSHLFKPSQRERLFVLLAIFFFFLGFSGIEAQFTAYATESLGLTGGQAAMTLGYFVLSLVVCSLPAGLLGSKLGKQRVMRWGCFLLAGVFIAAPFLKNVTLLRSFFILGGMGWSFILVQAYPIVADMGGQSEVGLMTGFYYFFSMSSAVVGPLVLGSLIDIFGYPFMFWTAGGAELMGLLFMSFAMRMGTRRNQNPIYEP